MPMNIPWYLHHQTPCTHSKPWLPHPHATSSGALSRSNLALAPAPMMSLPSVWVLVRDTVCTLSEGPVSPSPVDSYHKPHWPSKPGSLGAPHGASL